MGRTRHLTWTLTCDHCGKDGGEHGADGTLPQGWVEGGKAFCSEECVIEDARASGACRGLHVLTCQFDK